ncbi:helix-turn-helix domain-containing protein [Inquilinus limosus]|uniref:helix-turn-helix domain-containing protein n=1 Tax=Inquilinus limosus TaxID=171674 RepID=UPI00047CC82D
MAASDAPKRPRGRPRNDEPSPLDVHIGGRIRLRRTLLGYSQAKLASAIGLTFQQIQKYEHGSNRIGASRLHQLSRVLEVPVDFFFEDAPSVAGMPVQGLAEEAEPYDAGPDPMQRRETLELIRAYYRVEDPATRRRVLDLLKAMSGSRPDEGGSEEG